MTNEEYIINKRKAKFEQIWDKILKKLPNSSQKAMEINKCLFHTQLWNKKLQLVICRIVKEEKNNKSVNVVLDKKDLEKIFVNFNSYIEEINEYKKNINEELRCKGSFNNINSNARYRQLIKRLNALEYEKKYAEILFKLGGCSLKKEYYSAEIALSEIRSYICGIREHGKIGDIYHEFKIYGSNKIRYLIKRKYNLSDVLIEKDILNFVEFCINEDFKDLYDLLLIPYHNYALVEKYGADCLQKVISSIKTFIDLHTLEFQDITFEDLG